MHKFTKIAVSFLLILSLILNPFASALDIRANAVAGEVIAAAGLTFLIFVVNSIFLAVSGEAVEEIDEATKAYLQNHYEEIQQPIEAGGSPIVFESRLSEEGRQNLIDQGHLLPSEYPVVASIDPSASLTDSQREFYEKFVEEFNNAGIVAVENFNSGYVPSISASDYSKVKNNVTNFFLQNALNDSVTEAGQAGILPIYNFDFVGPMPSISYPVSTGMSTLMKDGFIHTIPYSSDIMNANGKFVSAEMAKSYAMGFDDFRILGNDSSGYYFNGSYTSYSGGRYILYNGIVYYRSYQSYTGNASANSTGSSTIAGIHDFVYYHDVNGVALSSVYTGGSYYQGFYYNKTGDVALDHPQVTTIDDSEFTTTGGGTVEIPRTEAEEVISQAMELGLINPDSTLELNEDGTIAGADGMTLAKLQELIDMIAEGQLDFENIQEYLDLITKLVASGNFTATEQATLLENLKELEKAQVDELTAIKEAITSIAATSEVAVDTDFDIETPDTIIDKFPFCLPFDVYTVFNLLSAEPEAPSFDIPFKMDGVFDFSMEIDLSEFDAIANIVRWFIYIIFILGLIFVTNNLIGRG